MGVERGREGSLARVDAAKKVRVDDGRSAGSRAEIALSEKLVVGSDDGAA
jgi:hypothetical protein